MRKKVARNRNRYDLLGYNITFPLETTLRKIKYYYEYYDYEYYYYHHYYFYYYLTLLPWHLGKVFSLHPLA